MCAVVYVSIWCECVCVSVRVLFLCISHGASTWSVVNLIFGACTNMCSQPPSPSPSHSTHSLHSLFISLALVAHLAALLHSQTPQTLPLNSHSHTHAHTHSQADARATWTRRKKEQQQQEQQRANCKAPFFHMTWLIKGSDGGGDANSDGGNNAKSFSCFCFLPNLSVGCAAGVAASKVPLLLLLL